MPFARSVVVGGFGHVRAVVLGEGSPVAAQTMWKDPFNAAALAGKEGDALIARLDRLQRLGCQLLRFAVPDEASAGALGALAARISLPLIADIHFDYKLALRCLDFPIAKIRINPGNIGSKEKRHAVLDRCAEKNVPVRIGINAGSLPHDLRRAVNDGMRLAEALVKAAERELELFDEFHFEKVVVSMKASSVAETIEANELFAARYKIPLHIGVTEAGPLIAGVVRNTAALYRLLSAGCGATVRVSLSDSVENELIAAREILLASGRAGGVRIISCPRCGRAGFDTHRFTEKWRDELYTLNKDITVAVMGCAVNGPGEARNADLGITGTGTTILLFKQGKIIRTIDESEADDAFRAELDLFAK
ncbi:MAG: (E)-4-hydroxy-3-methylbut-2-enyl-diphosphate synthase [Spirochaetaceae bacterium]|jgi:(E)-4-hydroxy-3-methylbut-2-enyl-diphosphate synthase|nr:(E)-4-hydroxy-3-methylbut-2-enyl-diphosphate synthase [Spirochaetaceae bacterium]